MWLHLFSFSGVMGGLTILYIEVPARWSRGDLSSWELGGWSRVPTTPSRRMEQVGTTVFLPPLLPANSGVWEQLFPGIQTGATWPLLRPSQAAPCLTRLRGCARRAWDYLKIGHGSGAFLPAPWLRVTCCHPCSPRGTWVQGWTGR